MSLTVTNNLITSDRIDRYAWRGAVDGNTAWFASWTGTCFVDTHGEAETLMRYAELVEADGPHPDIADADVDDWSTAIDKWDPAVAAELRAGHLADFTVLNEETPQDLYLRTAA